MSSTPRVFFALSFKTCSNKANILVQHHPTLLDATCWPCLNTMLDDVGLSLNLLNIFFQHRATLLAQQCCTMLASFEQAFKVHMSRVFSSNQLNWTPCVIDIKGLSSCRVRVEFVSSSCRVRVEFVSSSCRVRVEFVSSSCRVRVEFV